LGGGLSRTLLCAATAALALAGAAQAQTSGSGSGSGSTAPSTSPPSISPPATSGSKSNNVSGVTVTGKAPDYRRDADKRSYNIATDLNASHGSIADALRNIPSVDVDLQGNVSLRGDSNVTIMVDGQPSALFKGANRADLLQQLPADQYERVEVMTNPSAAYSPEGTAGIINLVTKKSHKAPASGTLSLNVQSTPQVRASASGNVAMGKLTLTGSLSGSYQQGTSDAITTEHLTDPVSGEGADVTSQSANRRSAWQVFGGGQGTDQLDKDTRLTEALFAGLGAGRTSFINSYASSALTGPLAQDYTDAGGADYRFHGLSTNTIWRRDLGGDDHTFTVNLSYSLNASSVNDIQDFIYTLPVQPDLYQAIASDQSYTNADFKAEYHGPLPGKAKLVAGYDLSFQGVSTGRGGLLGTDVTDSVVSPMLTDRFTGGQWVNALYFTYDRPFGRLDVQPGLRLEEANVDTLQLDSGVRGSINYFQPYPTLHIAYDLGGFQRLTASYSRRVDRPSPQQLNPARIYNDPLSFSEGNPDLKPAITDSYEFAYEYNGKTTYFLGSVYFKDKGNVVDSLTEPLAGGALLSTFGNVGHDRNLGVELTGNDHLSKTLTLSATVSADWDDLVDPSVVIGGSRTGVHLAGKAKLNWSPTPRDFVQIDYHYNGRQVLPQGYQEPLQYFNIGYRRLLTDRITAELSVLDPFNTARFTTVTSIPDLNQRSTVFIHARSVSLKLSYALGRVARQMPQRDIDFGGGGGGAPGGGGGAPGP
jgi:outer membrane receptor protein involved in Fe transport